MNFTKYASKIETYDNLTDIWASVLDVVATVDLEFAIYLTVAPDRSDVLLLTNVSEIYDGHDPAQDPFLEHCCASYDITRTGPSYLEEHAYLSDESKLFIKKASDSGFRTGLAIPMRLEGSERFGGFNLGSRLQRAEFEEKIIPIAEQLRFFCLLAHRRIEEVTAQDTYSSPEEIDETSGFRKRLISPQPTQLDKLTPREREVIYLIARGMTRKECARMCKISPHTVSDYMKSAYRKLGVRNKVEAARIVNVS